MGWSYRKSFGSGPFRVNFSKSGISYSFGVKGARINTGPRGTYVNLSSHGINYRRKIQGGGQHPSFSPSHFTPHNFPIAAEEHHNIASADIYQLSDTDSKDFIRELTEKAGKSSYVFSLGIFPLIVFLLVLAFTSFSNKTVVTQPASDSTLVKVTSPIGAYIRRASDAKSTVVRTTTVDQTFMLADSTNRKWLKVAFHDSVGYINRRFADIQHVHHDQVTENQAVTANPYAGYLLIIGLVVFIIWIRWLKKLDKRRFEMELHYEMDEQFKQVYRQFANHFATFSRSARIWQYLNTQRTGDLKRNGGAGNLIKRVALQGISGNQVPLRHFITNVSIPYLKLSNLEFYFLPERLLVKRGGTFAAVFYKNLRIGSSVTRFIEEESVAGDATVVGNTWKYINKNGGPDRRFNDNRQIPICAYSEYTLTSDTGVYEVITTSKQGAMDAFAGFLVQIGDLQAKMAIDN
ncbi:DUF4236 domain-containing protein [Mucilaginibacter sp. E4BP6]|uniref:DUF4236 domain-containing protein n=1 Tax=Mucilaginibacter sp. E4BP6 TaxID=2723089 RepID=UPI0015CEDB18|nr:DUF4236 domain-containing protein [Mucilaginibacter sp. E4BP6]NYE64893.1 hypothetical protein [Mucilaginibacter sp. E4BP6]